MVPGGHLVSSMGFRRIHGDLGLRIGIGFHSKRWMGIHRVFIPGNGLDGVVVAPLWDSKTVLKEKIKEEQLVKQRGEITESASNPFAGVIWFHRV